MIHLYSKRVIQFGRFTLFLGKKTCADSADGFRRTLSYDVSMSALIFLASEWLFSYRFAAHLIIRGASWAISDN